MRTDEQEMKGERSTMIGKSRKGTDLINPDDIDFLLYEDEYTDCEDEDLMRELTQDFKRYIDRGAPF